MRVIRAEGGETGQGIREDSLRLTASQSSLVPVVLQSRSFSKIAPELSFAGIYLRSDINVGQTHSDCCPSASFSLSTRVS